MAWFRPADAGPGVRRPGRRPAPPLTPAPPRGSRASVSQGRAGHGAPSQRWAASGSEPKPNRDPGPAVRRRQSSLAPRGSQKSYGVPPRPPEASGKLETVILLGWRNVPQEKRPLCRPPGSLRSPAPAAHNLLANKSGRRWFSRGPGERPAPAGEPSRPNLPASVSSPAE